MTRLSGFGLFPESMFLRWQRLPDYSAPVPVLINLVSSGAILLFPICDAIIKGK